MAQKNSKQMLFEMMSKIDPTYKPKLNEVFGFSAKEKEGKANQQKIEAAKEEVGKYNFNRIFFIPSKKDEKYVDIEQSKNVRINGIKQELPLLAELIPSLFDLNQGTATIMMLSNPNRYEGLIPSNWYPFLRDTNGYISNEKAIETLNRELDGIGQKKGLQEVQDYSGEEYQRKIHFPYDLAREIIIMATKDARVDVNDFLEELKNRYIPDVLNNANDLNENQYQDESGTKASIVVASHLSDAQIEMSTNRELAKVRMNFIKFIVNKLDGNLNQRINPDKMFEDYVQYYGIDMEKVNPR